MDVSGFRLRGGAGFKIEGLGFRFYWAAVRKLGLSNYTEETDYFLLPISW